MSRLVILPVALVNLAKSSYPKIVNLGIGQLLIVPRHAKMVEATRRGREV